jgi:hypothetical protein
VLGDRRGEKMSLREKNGEELDQVEVAHSSPSSNSTCQMSSASVDTSWSVTTPRYHRLPNFMRTCRPTRWLG